MSTDVSFRNDRNTPQSKEKSPVHIEDMVELMKLLAKYIATNKNQNFQKTLPDGHTILVKYNKFQRESKNRIKHFLPRDGDHPVHTLNGVIL